MGDSSNIDDLAQSIIRTGEEAMGDPDRLLVLLRVLSVSAGGVIGMLAETGDEVQSATERISAVIKQAALKGLASRAANGGSNT